MRIQIVDPAAYTPPYDHALCSALAAAGAQVELITSRFRHAEPPAPEGYTRTELFYRHGPGSRVLKLLQHGPGMIRLSRLAHGADLVHFQWLPVQPLDRLLLPRGRPLVLTAHDVLPRQPRAGQLAAQLSLLRRMDAVIVHSEHGRRRLAALGIERVHVIRHGVLRHHRRPVPRGERPVVLCFGLMRPYKGIDVLLEAWRGIEDAELWLVGAPRMDIGPLRRAAPPNVRWIPRYVSEDELIDCFERADIVVLPYREIDQSGVLFTALGFGKPLVLSDAGGFPELGDAALSFPAGDARALQGVLRRLLDDGSLRDRLGGAAAAAASGPYAWEQIARRTLELYESLLER